MHHWQCYENTSNENKMNFKKNVNNITSQNKYGRCCGKHLFLNKKANIKTST